MKKKRLRPAFKTAVTTASGSEEAFTLQRENALLHYRETASFTTPVRQLTP